MTDIRQSTLYAQFMTRIGWQVEKLDGVFIYIKKLPFLPPVIKIQRPSKLPSEHKLQSLLKKYKSNQITIEPAENSMLHVTCYMLHENPFLQTKTILIDLTASKNSIFNRFKDTKRRAVRRAQKLGVQIEISENIDQFIKLKNRTAGIFLGFLTTRGITKPLWQTFAPKQARVLLAYREITPPISPLNPSSPPLNLRGGRVGLLSEGELLERKYVAGILLLWHDKTAYYWMASATKEGKKLFAPTLLVWEALKFAKSQGCAHFDFEGVYDERYPHLGKDWQGFTKFKQGFGGKEVYYPSAFQIKS